MKYTFMTAVVFSYANIALASLTLNFDPTTEELFFTGNEQMFLEDPYQDGYEDYFWNSNGFSDYTYQLWFHPGSLLPSTGAIDPISCIMQLSPAGGINVGFLHLYDAGWDDLFTLEGSGVRTSYSFAPQDVKDALQNYSAGDLHSVFPEGTPMSVQVVPEPSSVLLLIAGTGGLLFYRRSYCVFHASKVI